MRALTLLSGVLLLALGAGRRRQRPRRDKFIARSGVGGIGAAT